jgi:hypothetical protein
MTDATAAVTCWNCGAALPAIAATSNATTSGASTPAAKVAKRPIPDDADVFAEVERLQNRPPSYWGALGVLAITLVLYAAAAPLDGAWVEEGARRARRAHARHPGRSAAGR